MSGRSLAVLTGGLDSAVLAVESCASFDRVYPLFIRQGLLWEDMELKGLQAFFAAVSHPALAPLTELALPATDLYGRHWSMTGAGTPDASTEDAAVYLPGKNLMLVTKAAVWCERNGVGAMALATLDRNPFTDNSPDFYDALARAIELGLGTRIEVLRPYSSRSKEDVIQGARHLPLHLAFSCLRPEDGRPCGACNKCEERRQAFKAAGIPDRTAYATARPGVP